MPEKENSHPKAYSFGSATRGAKIEAAFKEIGARNPSFFKFRDPGSIYFVNEDGVIEQALPGSTLFYVITNSSDWERLKIKSKPYTHTITITAVSGSDECFSCEKHGACSEGEKRRCGLARLISSMSDGAGITAKGMRIFFDGEEIGASLADLMPPPGKE